jgi:hypothetical protein
MTAIHTALSGEVPREMFDAVADGEWQAQDQWERHQANLELQRQRRELLGQ